MSKVDAVIGLQRGDEGKGRFVDLLASDYEIIARGNGGANAGHTVSINGKKPLALHQVPSGIAYPDKLNIIGNGTYVDPVLLLEEINEIKRRGFEVTTKNLAISDTAHLVMPHHKELDGRRESGKSAQGSTKRGIAYVASDKYVREGLRTDSLTESDSYLKDFALKKLELAAEGKTARETTELAKRAEEWLRSAKEIKKYITDTVALINERLDKGDRVLAEGAQAHWLDINHGMYPSVTSSSTTIHGLLDGLGVPPSKLGTVTGVAKAIKSHVGGGPFVTEINDRKLAEQIRGNAGDVDAEFGASTKRPRRIGYFDLVELQNAVKINGVNRIALSKLDQVGRYGDKTKIAIAYNLGGRKISQAPCSALSLENCLPVYQEITTWKVITGVREYSKLPKAAKDFIGLIESTLDTPVAFIGVGAEREQVITR